MAVNAMQYTSLFKEIGLELDKGSEKQRKKAANVVRAAIRQKLGKRTVSAPGQPPAKDSGNLQKGVYAKHDKRTSYVGIRSPGYHQFIMEFGREAGTDRKGRAISRMEPRPSVYPTFAEKADEVERIMSEPWVK